MQLQRSLVTFLIALAASVATPAIATAQGSPVVVSTEIPFYVPFNGTRISAFGQGPTLTLEGNLYFGLPAVDLCLGLNPSVPSGCPGTALVEFDLKAGFALEVTADEAGAIRRKIPLGYVPIAFFYFPALPQLTGWLFMGADLVLEGNVEAGMRSGFVGQFDLGGSLDLLSPATSVVGPPANSFFEFSPPELSGNSQLDLEVAFEGGVFAWLLVSGFPIGGPYLKARAGVGVDVDPSDDPWWEANATVGTAGGWSFSGIPGAGVGFTTELDLPIADAGGPLPGWTGAPARWSRAYDVENFEELTALAPVDDDWITTGNFGDSGNQPWLARLADDGAIEWEQKGQLASSTFARPTDVVPLVGGGYAIGGSAGTAGGSRIDTYDADDLPAWSSAYVDTAGGGLDLSSSIATRDGGLAFGGTHREGLDKHPTVVKLDAAGNVEWASRFTLDVVGGVDSAETGALIETRDGRLVLCGNASYSDGPLTAQTIDDQNAMLVAFEADGTLAWAKIYGGTGFDVAKALVELDIGDLLFGGQVGEEDHSMWLARVDPEGALVTSTAIGSEGGTSADFVADLSAVAGGALLAGSTLSGAAAEGWVARVDRDTHVVWFKSFRGPDLDELLGVEALADGYVAWGHTQSPQPLGAGGAEEDFWIVRGPNDGMLHFEPSFGLDVHNDRRGQSLTSNVVELDLLGWWEPRTVVPATALLAFDLTAAIVTLLTL